MDKAHIGITFDGVRPSVHEEQIMRGHAARETVRTTMLVVALLLTAGRTAAGQEKRIAPGDAWVRLPAAGETQTVAVVSFENSTMYDVYLTSATADVAGKVELRDAGRAGDAAVKPLEFITVPAHEWAYMDPKGAHLLLMDLKRPLKEGDTVVLTVKTETGTTVEVAAVVKKQ
jgi:copper(I)-binding protein